MAVPCAFQTLLAFVVQAFPGKEEGNVTWWQVALGFFGKLRRYKVFESVFDFKRYDSCFLSTCVQNLDDHQSPVWWDPSPKSLGNYAHDQETIVDLFVVNHLEHPNETCP